MPRTIQRPSSGPTRPSGPAPSRPPQAPRPPQRPGGPADRPGFRHGEPADRVEVGRPEKETTPPLVSGLTAAYGPPGTDRADQAGAPEPSAPPGPPPADPPGHSPPGTDREAEAKAREASSLPPPPPAGQPGYDYRSSDLKVEDVRKAQTWKPGDAGPSGTDANKHINESYHHLNQEFQRWLHSGPDGRPLQGMPPISDWTSFGKYASREAGEQIRNIENVQKATRAGDAEAALEAARGMAGFQQLQQAGLLGAATAADNLRRQNPLEVALTPGVAGAKTGLGAARDMLATMDRMRHALVKGNTEIFANIAPAYEAFLKGESTGGKGGLQALQDAGYFPGSTRDPQGWITRGFENYAQAKGKLLEADKTNDPARRQQLVGEARQLMHTGNLYVGFQEQYSILQKMPGIFSDPVMQKALDALSGTMTLTDANGTRSIGQPGKSWADFEARMGIRRVPPGTPGAIPLQKEDGTTLYYAEDTSARGTISEYFRQGLSGPPAANLAGQRPRPLDLPPPVTRTGQGLQQTARGLNGGYNGLPDIAAGTVRTIGGVPSDIGLTAGQLYQQAAHNLASQALREWQAGGVLNGTSAVTKMALAQQAQTFGLATSMAGHLTGLATDYAANVARTEVRNFQNGLRVIGQGANRVYNKLKFW